VVAWGPDSIGAAVEGTLWLHQTGPGVSIGLLPCELYLPPLVPLYLYLLGLNNDGLVN
jgi:hypothetical protein